MDLLSELISAARGELEVDLLLEGAEIVNTLSSEVHRADVALHSGRVVGFDCYSAKEVLDLRGAVLAPGFIDGHVHIESAMVTVSEYARAVVPKGCTSVIIDPHEIANVMGIEGIRYMLDSSRHLPLNVFVMLPSSVPTTDLETSGGILDAEALSQLIDDEGVLGLAEVMNYPGVIFRDPEVLNKIKLFGKRPVDGHAPKLTGRDLSAYIVAGIKSEHECTSAAEAEEKLRLGMHIMIREGSAAKNLKDLLPLVTARNARQFLFVSDDRHPADILREGHIDFMVKTAIREGLDPILAFQMASLNAAQYFGLKDLGAIAPGQLADIVVLKDFDRFEVAMVFKSGQIVVKDGHLVAKIKKNPAPIPSAIRIGKLDAASFEIESKPGLARAIGLIPDQIITRSLAIQPKTADGKVVADIENDIAKMAVVERHKATGNIGLGLLKDFGLHAGAVATSIAHDSHNISVVGVDDDDMLEAVRALREMGGGIVAIKDKKIMAGLPLPVAGILSDRNMEDVAEGIDHCIEAAHELGCRIKDPFMTLSFLSLPVIPELKLTDKGLVDVRKFDLVPLFIENS